MPFLLAACLAVLGAGPTPVDAADADVVSPTQLERIVQTGVREILSRMLDVDVQLDRVSVDRDERLLELHGLRVGNPRGFSETNAFTADTVRVKGELRSLLSREPTIELIDVQGAEVTAENTLTAGSNLMVLMRRAQNARPSGPLARLRPQKEWRIDQALLGETNVNIVNQLVRRHRRVSELGPAEFSFGTDGERVSGEEIVSEFLTWIVGELGLFEDRPGLGEGLVEWLPRVF